MFLRSYTFKHPSDLTRFVNDGSISTNDIQAIIYDTNGTYPYVLFVWG